MASRTKDNFHGYNGIPMEEKPKKRQGRESSSDRNIEGAEHMTGDEMEQYEYSQTESEPELEEHEEKPARASVKPKAPPKSAPPVMNFSDLLKLAEKKQHEPVEIKIVKKTEERPLTAEELREREYLERKNRKGVVVKEKKVEKEMKHTIASSSSKKEILQKELMNAKSSKHSADKHTFSKGSLSSHSAVDKKSKGPALLEKQSKLSSSSKPSYIEKAKPAAPKGHLKNSTNSSHSKPVSSEGRKSGPNSHTEVLKRTANGTLKQPAKEPNLNKPANHMKPAGVAAAQHESVKISVSKQVSSSSGTGGLLSRAKSSSNTGPGRPSNSLVTGHGSQKMGPGQTALGQRSGGLNMGSDRPGSTLGTGSGRPGGALGTGSGRPAGTLGTGSGRPGGAVGTGSGRPGGALGTGSGRPGSALGTGSGRPGGALGTGSGRPPSSSGPVRTASSQSVGPGRPGNSLSTGMGRNSTLGSGPGQPSSASAGTLKPKCTVVSETISSKNLVPRNSSSQMNGMRPFPQQRPGIPAQGFPRPSLPPITSKRQYEDEDEYDSEMEDFIDDEGEAQEEISKHIREIFGYDRTRYKDESDYALRYMESTWKEQQKEEARSLRLGMQEDLEEMKREEEELKRKKQAKKLRTH